MCPHFLCRRFCSLDRWPAPNLVLGQPRLPHALGSIGAAPASAPPNCHRSYAGDVPAANGNALIIVNSAADRLLRLRDGPIDFCETADASLDYGVSFFSVFPVSSFGVQSFVLCASIFLT